MAQDVMEILWRNALVVVPVVVAVGAFCRWTACRPATRHTLWLTVLAWLAIPPLLGALGVSGKIAEIAPSWMKVSRGSSAHETDSKAALLFPAEPLPEATALQTPDGATLQAPSTWPRPETAPAIRSTVPQAPMGSMARTDAAVADQSKNSAARGKRAIAQREVAPRGSAQNTRKRGGGAEASSLVYTPVPRERLFSELVGDGALSASLQPSVWKTTPGEAKRSTSRGPMAKAPRSTAGKAAGGAAVATCEPTTGAAAAAPAVPAAPAADEQASASGWLISPAVTSRSIVSFTVLYSVVAPMMDAVVRPAKAATEEWGARLGAVKDAFAALPPAPKPIWLFGSAAIVGLTLARTLWFQAALRRATPASGEVEWMVAEAADRLGLVAPPRTVMLDRRVSPMIWCGRRPVLVLPVGLWSELDEVGRAAVVFHELAHLKRRDHWARWGELLLGALYWWHPAVWWVRRRLREEADLCCDAWVMALLPTRRRAYAEALLKTRAYLSESSADAAPAAGLCVASADAKRFARRLTMVMTARVNPRTSSLGLATAGVLAIVGAIATPLWACPPASQEAKCASESRASAIAPVAPVAPAAPRAPRAPRAAMAPMAPMAAMPPTPPPAPPAAFAGAAAPGEGDNAPGMTSFEQHMRSRQPRPAMATPRVISDDQTDERLRALEKRLDRLTKQLEELMQSRGSGGGGGGAASGGWGVGGDAGPHADAGPGAAMRADRERQMAERMREQAVARQALRGARAGQNAELRSELQNKMRTEQRAKIRSDARAGGSAVVVGDTMTRLYVLPQPQLGALGSLMSRPDVPVRVRVLGNGIEVIGTEGQHRAFGAFVKAIGPGNVRAYKMTDEGKLEALTGLMALPDVSIYIRKGDGSITVLGGNSDQKAVGDFIQLIDPDGDHSEPRIIIEQKAKEKAKEKAKQWDKAPAPSRSEGSGQGWSDGKAEAMTEAGGDAAPAIEGQAAEIEAQAEMIEAQAEAIEAQSEAIREQMESAGDEVKETLQSQVDALTASADEIRAQADALRAQADALRADADVACAEGDAAEESMDWQSDALAEFAEAFGAKFGEWKEQLAERLAEFGAAQGGPDADEDASAIDSLREQIQSLEEQIEQLRQEEAADAATDTDGVIDVSRDQDQDEVNTALP